MQRFVQNCIWHQRNQKQEDHSTTYGIFSGIPREQVGVGLAVGAIVGILGFLVSHRVAKHCVLRPPHAASLHTGQCPVS